MKKRIKELEEGSIKFDNLHKLFNFLGIKVRINSIKVDDLELTYVMLRRLWSRLSYAGVIKDYYTFPEFLKEFDEYVDSEGDLTWFTASERNKARRADEEFGFKRVPEVGA